MDPVGLARVAIPWALAGAVALATSAASAATDDSAIRVVLWADRDDDDANGVPDGEQRALPPVTHVDLVPMDKRLMGAVLQVASGGEHARVVLGKDGPLPWGARCRSRGGSRG